jgi:tripeptidyl-peptidase I
MQHVHEPDLCTDQLKSYVAPTSATLAAFRAFAEANGLALSSLSDTNEWFQFTTTVARANELFGASYQRYTHVATGTMLMRTLAYSLPEELVGHVDTLTPATGFKIEPRMVTKSELLEETIAPNSCNTLAPNSSIMPNCLQV